MDYVCCMEAVVLFRTTTEGCDQVVGWKQKSLNKAENLIRNLPLRAHYLLWGVKKCSLSVKRITASQ